MPIGKRSIDFFLFSFCFVFLVLPCFVWLHADFFFIRFTVVQIHENERGSDLSISSKFLPAQPNDPIRLTASFHRLPINRLVEDAQPYYAIINYKSEQKYEQYFSFLFHCLVDEEEMRTHTHARDVVSFTLFCSMNKSERDICYWLIFNHQYRLIELLVDCLKSFCRCFLFGVATLVSIFICQFFLSSFSIFIRSSFSLTARHQIVLFFSLARVIIK